MAIDTAKILSDPTLRARIPAVKYAEYAQDEDALLSDISDGHTVFYQGWGGDFPGNSGANYVICWQGLYFGQSSDYGSEGPFQSLEDALSLDWFDFQSPSLDISSNEMSFELLAKFALEHITDQPNEIKINSKAYVLRSGSLVLMDSLEN